jgi:predicted transcriptional regulator
MTTLKELREQQFLSVGELASKAGISRTAIYDIEAGLHKPIRRTIRALAKALGVNPQDIKF